MARARSTDKRAKGSAAQRQASRAPAGKKTTTTKKKPAASRTAAPKSRVKRPPVPARKPARAARPPWQDPHAQAMSPLFHVPDVAAGVRFYRDGLGFTCVMLHEPASGAPDHALLDYHGTTLMLSRNGAQPAELASRSALAAEFNSVYLYVQDVDRATEHAASLGARVLQPPQDTFWGDRCSVLLSPQGHRLVLATHRGR